MTHSPDRLPATRPSPSRRGAARRAAAVLAALPLCATGLSACSGGPAPRTAAPPVTAPPAASGTPSASPTRSPSASRAPLPSPSLTPPVAPVDPNDPVDPVDPLASKPPFETAPPAGLPTCLPSDLTVTDGDAAYTSDAVQELFVLRTTGPDCQLTATYPSVQVLGSGGAPLGTVRQGGLGLPAPAGGPLTISRTTSLSFYVATARDGACVPAATVSATLPGTTVARSAATQLQVCGGLLSVGPLQRLGDTG